MVQMPYEWKSYWKERVNRSLESHPNCLPTPGQTGAREANKLFWVNEKIGDQEKVFREKEVYNYTERMKRYSVCFHVF